MLEKGIEEYLILRVKSLGGECIKVETSSSRGWPDRLCIIPGGKVFFVETKKPVGGVLSKFQYYTIAKIRALGACAYVAHTREGIDAILHDVQSEDVVANGV